MRALLPLILAAAFSGTVLAPLTALAQLAEPLERELPAATEPSAVLPALQRVVSLENLGRPQGVQLSGVNRRAQLSAGVRLDELVTEASLALRMIYPPGMRHDQSFLRVYVNDQLTAISQLSEARAGNLHTVFVPLEPELFTDFATVTLELDATYDDTCVSPQNPTLRLDIRPESTLRISYQPLALVDDLAILPAPFFDPRDNNRLQLPMVLPAERTPVALKTAGVLASWFGAQASYRQASFTIVDQPQAEQHSVVLSTGALLPTGMQASDIKGPTLVVDSLPDTPWIKQLYILGRDDNELLEAVHALVIEGPALSGRAAVVSSVNLGSPRKPYDAPRYVPTDRPVRFAELMDFPNQLEVDSDRPRADLNLRLPPDLFSWAGRNIPMSLKYRYTAPSRWNDSLLNIEINGGLIQSFRLAPRAEQAQSRLNLDLLGQSQLASQESLQIPAFRVGGNNQLSFAFGFMPEGNRNCSGVPVVARASIDPESTIDFSKLPHYTRMPNLAAFSNGGYPFTILADLADTVFVLPEQATGLEQQSFLNLMGLFGQWTGLPASRVEVALTNQPANLQSKHWIALGTSDRLAWLNQLQKNLPMVLSETERSMGLPRAAQWFKSLWQADDERLPDESARAMIQTSGSLGAIMGFESHATSKKAGLVITGTDQDGFERAVGALQSFADQAKVRGSVALVRADEIQSFSLGTSYVSGNLPWWLKIRIAFSEYPALIAVTGALAGVVLAMLAFGWLANRARKRIKGS